MLSEDDAAWGIKLATLSRPYFSSKEVWCWSIAGGGVHEVPDIFFPYQKGTYYLRPQLTPTTPTFGSGQTQFISVVQTSGEGHSAELVQAAKKKNGIPVELQWLEHWWLVYHGYFKLVFESLEKNPVAADLE